MPARDKLSYEDFRPGRIGSFGPRPVTGAELIAFAAEFDPQPMHLDAQAARSSMLGEISGSGWHLCVMMQRMAHDGFLKDAHSLGSPGIDEVRWLAPLRPGDELTLDAAVIDCRPLRSRADTGLVTFRFEMFNRAGVRLLECVAPVMMRRRAPDADAKAETR
ncbi:MAG: MaoC family dehydratase [Xanthobacteraceae bacterium]|nr:MAG: MaoC family dehydratase [Xanthobacteraceae bacterium]